MTSSILALKNFDYNLKNLFIRINARDWSDRNLSTALTIGSSTIGDAGASFDALRHQPQAFLQKSDEHMNRTIRERERENVV